MPGEWARLVAKVEAEGCCRICGSNSQLDPAHIIPRSVGGGMEPNDIVPLCRKCHTKYDNFEIDLLPHLDTDEQATAVRRARGIYRAFQRITGHRWQIAD